MDLWRELSNEYVVAKICFGTAASAPPVADADVKFSSTAHRTVERGRYRFRQHAARPLLASVGLRWLRLRLRFCLRLRLWATTLSSILVAPEHTTHDSSNHLVSSRVCKAALKTDDLPATCERKAVLCVFLPRRTSNRIVRFQLVHTFEVCTTGLHVCTSSILPNSS